MRLILQQLAFVFCLSSIFFFRYQLSNAQTTIVNYDFNVGTSYPTLTPVLANSITCTPTSTEAFTTFAGTASGGLAFSVNSTSGNAIAMSNSSGTNTKYFQFQLGGTALVNYITYKIYFQSQRSGTGATTITLAYSTDGASYTNFGTTASPGNGIFTEAVLDLSAVTALNNAPSIYFRLMASGASGTGSLRIDNLQMQAVNNCALPSEPTTNASSVSFPDVQCTQLTLNWANGNGSNRMVVVRQGTAVAGTPTDGLQYTANSVFGSGETIAASEFVVYNGAGASVTITGLSRKTTYYFKVFEYNISGTCPNYLTTGVVASGSAQSLYCTLGVEIENVLVDACVPGGGDSSACTSEGRNEMVLFLVGANPLNTADLTIAWPNNSYLGISPQNVTTDTLVAQLNATILTSCGRLIQPVSGVLPANKRVLLITSTDMCVAANSFSTLNDTLIVIFQNAGNTSGHFANSTTTALCTPNCIRTLTMTFSNPPGTFDDVSYYRDSIGSSDGSAVKYSADGVATSFNNGCQAPYFPLAVSMVGLSSLGSDSVCNGDTLSLQANVTGSYKNVFWSGGNGTFSNTDSVKTIYYPVSADSNSATLNVRVIGVCDDTVNASYTFKVVYPPTITLSLGGNDTICGSNTVSVIASGGTSYLWSTGATTDSIAAGATGYFSVSVTNMCGTKSDSVYITKIIPPAATIAVSDSIAFCTGDSAVLTSSDAPPSASFSWSTGSSSQTVTVLNSGTFSVTVSNFCGSSNTSVSVTAVSPASVTIAPSGTLNICPGDSALVTASGVPPQTYSWSTGSTSDSIYIKVAGTYFVTATNFCGADTDSVSLIVSATPTAAIGASGPLTLCAGDSVQLSASGGTNYSWSNGSILSSIFVSQSNTYTVTVTGSCGSDTESVTVTVNPLPAAVITPFGSTTFCAGDSVQLAASGGVSYNWSNGLSTAVIKADTAGIYTVTVTNSCGSDTESVTVNVNPLPAAVITASGSTTFCAGDSVQLAASGGTSYLWSNGLFSSVIKADTAGNYVVTVTTSCGSDTESVQVTVNPLPVAVITASGSTTFCAGDSVKLTALGGTSYQWSNGSPAPFIYASQSIIYSLIATNNCGSDTDSITVTLIPLPAAAIAVSGSTTFCAGDSVQLTASGGTSYKWSAIDTFSVFTVKQTGIFIVTVTNTCGSDTESVQVTVNPLPVAAIGASGSTSFCTGDSVQLTASGGTSYKWSAIDTFAVFIAKLAGTYVVTVTNSCGSDTESVKVTINPLPNAVLDTSGSILLCTGNTLILHASGGTTYKWSDSTSADSLVVSNSGSYYFTVLNTCGSDTSDTVVVTSAIKPYIAITSGGDTAVCPGKTVVLTASGNVPFTWSGGSTQSSITVTAAGTYIVSGTNLCGTAADTVVVVNSSVKAGFTPKDTAGGVPLSTTFVNSSKGASSYLWDFGDGTTSTVFEPAHTYTTGGIFTVKLVTSDSMGCRDTFLYRSITATMDFYIPNMFSPNGDNENDVFRVRGLEGRAKWIHALIFNRWGEVIWEWNELDGSWNGSTLQGKAAQEGVYVYMIDIMFKTDVEQKFTGNVTLIR